MRTPNPRVALPILLAAAGGAAVGYFVTAASCAPGSCLPAAVGMAVVVGLVAAIGVGTVVILAVRSFAEWREHTEREVLVMEEKTVSSPKGGGGGVFADGGGDGGSDAFLEEP